MLRALSAGILVIVVGCASGGGAAGMQGAGEVADAGPTRCAPIVSDSLIAGVPVYPPCGVDIRARAVGTPIRPQYTPGPGASCVAAHVRAVVDAQGHVVPKSERLIRTTDPTLYTAMLAEIPRMRYEPAKKDGQPVAQIVEITWMAAIGRAGGPKPMRC